MKNFKKLLVVFFFTVVVMAFALPYAASAEEIEYSVDGGYIYFDSATGTITGAKGIRNLNIPDEINGVKIVAIADDAFKNTSFSSVTIPGSVKKIGYCAFYGTDIGYLTISDGVEEIGELAFYDNQTLKSLTIPGSVKTIGYGAFSECAGLSNLVLEEGIETIGDYAFNYNKITELVIPGSVKSIGAHAFELCDELVDLTISEGVESIGDYAFCDTALITVDIPASVKQFGDFVFDYTHLKSINVHEDNIAYTAVDGVLFTRDMKELVVYPLDKDGVQYTIPESVVRLSDGAFRRVTYLRKLVVSENLVEFDANDFSLPYYKDRIDTVYYTCSQEEWKSVERGDFGEYVTTHIFGYPCSVNGHSWGEWTEDVAATCKAEGSEYRSCTACKTTETRETATLPHSFGDWIVITPPTENSAGVKIRICSVCSFSEFGAIPAIKVETDPILSVDALNITVHNLDGVKDFFIGKGTHNTYRDTKNNSVMRVTAARINGAYKYTCTVNQPGVYTVCVRFDDPEKENVFLYAEVSVTMPEITVNGVQVTVSNLDDVKVIRTAPGEWSTPGEVKRAEGNRNFTAKNSIKGADPYTIRYSEDGVYTVTIEYNNGLCVVETVEIKRMEPTVEQNGNRITFGNLDGLYVIRYAKGEYASSYDIKRAEGSMYKKPSAIVGGVITVDGLEKGTYTFCVQYNDETYNYYTIVVE